MGHSRLGGPSWRSNHVRNAPLATVGPKKAACRDGPINDIVFCAFAPANSVQLQPARASLLTPSQTFASERHKSNTGALRSQSMPVGKITRKTVP